MSRQDASRSRRSGRAFAIELGMLVGAGVLFLLARSFSWGAGVFRFLALVSLAALVVFASTRARPLSSPLAAGWGRRLLIACVLCLLALHARALLHDIREGGGCLTDMGRPSICAGQWILAGKNPWAECWTDQVDRPEPGRKATALQWCLKKRRCIDRKAGGHYRGFPHGPGFDFMDGYKYGPLMALTYLPATSALIERGLYLTNALFWFAMLALVFRIARAAYPDAPSASWRALLAILVVIVLPLDAVLPELSFTALGTPRTYQPPSALILVRELTTTCSNDMLPVTFVLGAVAFAAAGHSLLAGVLIGLSMATKQLPAPLVAILLVRMQGVDWKRLVGAAVATATLCYLPFFLAAPREMIANLVRFNVLRPSNSSSIRLYLPEVMATLVPLAQIACVFACAAYFHRRRDRTLAALLPVAALMLLSFVAFNKIVHGNYLLWVQPFVALVLAGAPFRARPTTEESMS